MLKATARTLREFLGLSVDHLAHLVGVNPRTVQRWEQVKGDPESPIPEDAEDLLWDILEWFKTSTTIALQQVRDTASEEGTPPEVVNLSRYVNDTSARRAGMTLPTSCHAALQGYILARLHEAGYECEVSWAYPEE